MGDEDEEEDDTVNGYDRRSSHIYHNHSNLNRNYSSDRHRATSNHTYNNSNSNNSNNHSFNSNTSLLNRSLNYCGNRGSLAMLKLKISTSTEHQLSTTKDETNTEMVFGCEMKYGPKISIDASIVPSLLRLNMAWEGHSFDDDEENMAWEGHSFDDDEENKN